MSKFGNIETDVLTRYIF